MKRKKGAYTLSPNVALNVNHEKNIVCVYTLINDDQGRTSARVLPQSSNSLIIGLACFRMFSKLVGLLFVILLFIFLSPVLRLLSRIIIVN